MRSRYRCVAAVIAPLALVFLAGCATYQDKVDGARKKLQNNDAASAAEILKPLASESGNDQLIYVFDLATSLQLAGDYKQSNQLFEKADHLADVKNYTSISRQAGSLLLSEEMVQYKGEDYEKLLINVMEALNYLMLGDHENALVEVRALDNKLNYYRLEEKKKYEQNTMALYISGLMWEDDHDYDSAYITYQKALTQAPNNQQIREAVLRSARLAQRDDEIGKWKSQFKMQVKPEWTDKNYGELVLIYQQGWGPRKYPRRAMPRLPELFPQISGTQQARMDIEGGPSIMTEKIYSVQDVAIKTLNDNYAALVAKRAAGFVAKEVVASQISQKNEALGFLVGLAMHASDRADLRQWSTLPESFQVARVFLKPGKYKVSIQGIMTGGQPSVDSMAPQEFEVKPHKKTFFEWRSFH